MHNLGDHEKSSSFFSLPAETRLEIYSYLLPSSGLEIDLCSPRRPEQHDFTFRRKSIISNLLRQVLSLDIITRTNGLHLLLVSQRTRTEVLPLLAKTIVRFHCPRCFEELLRNLSYGLGVGVKWMKHVEIVVDLAQSRQIVHGQMLTRQLGRVMATEAMGTCRKIAWLFYGRLDLSASEVWSCRPLNERLKGSEDDGSEMRVSTPPLHPNPYVHGHIGLHPHPDPPGAAGYNERLQNNQKWLLVGQFAV